MHQSAASPWGPPQGHPRDPWGICRDCQMFVALGCKGNYRFYSQRLHPWGQQWGYSPIKMTWVLVVPSRHLNLQIGTTHGART